MGSHALLSSGDFCREGWLSSPADGVDARLAAGALRRRAALGHRLVRRVAEVVGAADRQLRVEPAALLAGPGRARGAADAHPAEVAGGAVRVLVTERGRLPLRPAELVGGAGVAGAAGPAARTVGEAAAVDAVLTGAAARGCGALGSRT